MPSLMFESNMWLYREVIVTKAGVDTSLSILPATIVQARYNGAYESSATGSHAGSHRPERPSGIPDGHEQCQGTRPRSRTDLNESGYPHRNLRIRRAYSCKAGAAAPNPACMAPVAPLFHPLPSYADAAGSYLHQRGGTPHPESCH
jgi:hypothetical protein